MSNGFNDKRLEHACNVLFCMKEALTEATEAIEAVDTAAQNVDVIKNQIDQLENFLIEMDKGASR